jgi:hypothetical protein
MSKAETEFIQYFSAKNSVAKQMLRGLELVNPSKFNYIIMDDSD